MKAHILIITCAAVLLAATCLSSASRPLQKTAQVYEPEEGTIDLRQYTCASFLRITELDEGRQAVHVVWAHGYYSGQHGIDLDQPLTSQTLQKFNDRLVESCKASPAKLFLRAVEEMK